MKKILLIASLLHCIAIMPASAQDIDVEHLPAAKKLDWSGSIGASTSVYAASDIDQRSSPFAWNLYGNFNLKVLETWYLPFSFTINKSGSSLTKPFYQFGISPQYKWVKLHLGYRNLTFNPYTLAGHTFFGAGVELNPGKFRFAAMYGRLQGAVELDTSKGTINIPTFRRLGYGVKIGVGSADNFMDLILFHGRDESSSIHPWTNGEESKVLQQPLTPAENLAAGLSIRQTLFKKLRFSADLGVSAYNRNVRDTDLAQDFGIFRANASTHINWAGKASLGYQWKNFGLSADYERVLPEYTTMGSYFFNNDFENYTLSPSGHSSDGKLVFSASGGLQRNNLLGDRAQTNQRIIGNANIAYNPSAVWGLNLSYNNFVVNQRAGTVPLSDSIRIRQINQTFTLCPHYSIARDTAVTHSFSLCANVQDVADRNVLTRQYGNMNTYVLSLNHVTSYTASGRAINSGLNYNLIKTYALDNTQIGATLGFSQPFLKQTLNLNTNANYNFSLINGERDGSIFNLTLGASYTAGGRHSFAFAYNFINTASKQYQSYTEQLGTLSYNLRLK